MEEDWKSLTLHAGRSQSLPPQATTAGDSPSSPPNNHSRSIADASSETVARKIEQESHAQLEMSVTQPLSVRQCFRFNGSSVPKTPESDVRQAPLHSIRRPLDARHFFTSALKSFKRKETIVDDMPAPRRSARLRDRRSGQYRLTLCSPLKQGSTVPQLPLSQSKSQKRLRQVPSSAPRLVETKGVYTFRKGIRIRDYNIPLRRYPESTPRSLAYQCRDRFDGLDAASPAPMNMKESPPRTPERSTIDSRSNALTVDSKLSEAELMTPRSREDLRPLFSQEFESWRGCRFESWNFPLIKQEDGFERWVAQDTGNVDRQNPTESKETS